MPVNDPTKPLLHLPYLRQSATSADKQTCPQIAQITQRGPRPQPSALEGAPPCGQDLVRETRNSTRPDYSRGNETQRRKVAKRKNLWRKGLAYLDYSVSSRTNVDRCSRRPFYQVFSASCVELSGLVLHSVNTVVGSRWRRRISPGGGEGCRGRPICRQDRITGLSTCEPPHPRGHATAPRGIKFPISSVEEYSSFPLPARDQFATW